MVGALGESMVLGLGVARGAVGDSSWGPCQEGGGQGKALAGQGVWHRVGVGAREVTG